MTIRVLLFDLGDTVIRLEPYPEAYWQRLLEERCLEVGLADGWAARLAEGVAQEQGRLNARGREELDIPGTIARLLPDGDGDTADRLAEAWGIADVSRLVMPPGRGELLARLRSAGYRLGVISNTTTRGGLLDAYLGREGLLGAFEAVVYSSELGFRKPAAEIFREGLRRMGAEAGEALYVGDRHREDVQGPEAVGIRGVLTHEFRQEPAPLGTPTIAELGEIVRYA